MFSKTKQSCLKRYRNLLTLVNFCAKTCGADVLTPDYHINNFTFFVIFAIIIFFSCTAYTVYVGVIVEGDWTVILQALCMVGSGVEGCFKLASVIVNRDAMIELNSLLEQTYHENEEKSIAYRNCLRDRISIITKLTIAYLSLYGIICVILMSFPIIYWCIYHERIFVMQFLLPGIDHKTDRGHLLHCAAHVICLSLGAFGNFAGDMYLFIFVTNTPLLKNMIRIKIENLNEVINQTQDMRRTQPLLRDIIQTHQTYIRLITLTEQIFFVVVFVEIFATCFCIVSTLFCILIKVWPAAGAFLLYSVVILYTYCGLGTIIENSNEELCYLYYNECLWYKLQICQQKAICVMLQKTQLAKELSIGKIMPLSMSSALQLTKAIYSFVMMLQNYLGNR